MGFPQWTLWGMGLSALGALLFVTLALIGQSPGLMRRLGLDVYRLDLRVRAFTGYAFACLLLIGGFFLAGVPLSSDAAEPIAQENEATAEPGVSGSLEDLESGDFSTTITATVGISGTATETRPASGAFGGVPTRTTATATAELLEMTPDIPTPTSDGETSGTDDDGGEGTDVATETGTPTPISSDTPTPTASSTPTPTPSDTPTSTPTVTPTPVPSLTPTPIEGQTATVDSDGANIWLYRSPGGQQFMLVSHGETLILRPGHANQGGELWREIETLQGLAGWIQEDYLQ